MNPACEQLQLYGGAPLPPYGEVAPVLYGEAIASLSAVHAPAAPPLAVEPTPCRSRRAGCGATHRLATLVLDQGPKSLPTQDLLTLLLGGSAVEAATRALAEKFSFDGSGPWLRPLAAVLPEEVAAVPGIGPARAARLFAALDLARRINEECRPERGRIRTARDVYQRFRLQLRDLRQEEFHILLLNSQNEVMRDLMATRGTVDASLVHPREVFRAAIVESAASLILVHNHPSCDPTPSDADVAVTHELRAAGYQVGIEVLDHVIIGESRYVSFIETGLWDG
ncbi:MAG TPA: DNA repair protein RadC [Longimicrobiaceae bacterium]|nr:DNA repair protein RadC [Longimicrobiaceae bacterium]